MDKMFWEDIQQANDRLAGSFVMFGNDPVYVGCESRDRFLPLVFSGEKKRLLGRRSPIPVSVSFTIYLLSATSMSTPMKSREPQFHCAATLRAVRIHGLRPNGIWVQELLRGDLVDSRLDYTSIAFREKGYREAPQTNTPPLKKSYRTSVKESPRFSLRIMPSVEMP